MQRRMEELDERWRKKFEELKSHLEKENRLLRKDLQSKTQQLKDYCTQHKLR